MNTDFAVYNNVSEAQVVGYSLIVVVGVNAFLVDRRRLT